MTKTRGPHEIYLNSPNLKKNLHSTLHTWLKLVKVSLRFSIVRGGPRSNRGSTMCAAIATARRIIVIENRIALQWSVMQTSKLTQFSTICFSLKKRFQIQELQHSSITNSCRKFYCSLYIQKHKNCLIFKKIVKKNF